MLGGEITLPARCTSVPLLAPTLVDDFLAYGGENHEADDGRGVQDAQWNLTHPPLAVEFIRVLSRTEVDVCCDEEARCREDDASDVATCKR